jgi:CheY-like chemotaxis protein
MDHGDQVVLVVDDDTNLLRATEAILRRGGYLTIAASGPLEALEKSRGFQGAIHLLLTDVLMPAIDGPALAELILAERPQTRVLLISGEANVQSRLPLLKKPVRMKYLLEQVSNVIDGSPALPSDVLRDRESWGTSVRADLTAQLDEARGRFLESARNLIELMKDVPSGLPHPDGLALLQQSAKAQHRAFEEYQEARKKLDDHIAGDETKPER